MRSGGVQLLVGVILGCLMLGSCRREEPPRASGAVWIEFGGGDCRVPYPGVESIPGDAPPPTEDYPAGIAGDDEGELATCSIVPADDGMHVRVHLADGDRAFAMVAVFTTGDGETFDGSGSVEFTSYDTGAVWNQPDSCTFEATPPQGVEIIRDITRRAWASFRCEGIGGEGDGAGCTMEGVFAVDNCAS